MYGMSNDGPSRCFYLHVVCAAIAVVGFVSAESQSGYASSVENSKSSLSSLVGDTMSSANDVPFVWSPEYEVAIYYITAMWSEFEKPGKSSAVQGIVAKNGFLNYCVRFKNKLANFNKSFQGKADLKMTVKEAVSDWYRAVDELSRNGWIKSDAPRLESIKNQFRTAYKHLVINGGEIYGLPEIGKKEKQELNDFTREMADIMTGVLKQISRQIRDVPADTASI